MTYLKSFLITSMVMLTVSCSNVDRSRSFGDPSVNGKTLAQQVCSNCHGIDGNSGSEQFPKLAGQQKEYLLLQLKSFNDHSRTDRLAQEIMAGMSRDLTTDQANQIADYFSGQKPVNITKTSSNTQEGKVIFEQGIASKSVAACAICHGQNAAGYQTFPKLAGQHKNYLVKQLIVFKNGHGRPNTPMAGITQELSAEEIEKVSDYLANL